MKNVHPWYLREAIFLNRFCTHGAGDGAQNRDNGNMPTILFIKWHIVASTQIERWRWSTNYYNQ